jgi:hypothetical protein
MTASGVATLSIFEGEVAGDRLPPLEKHLGSKTIAPHGRPCAPKVPLLSYVR